MYYLLVFETFKCLLFVDVWLTELEYDVENVDNNSVVELLFVELEGGLYAKE